MSKLFWAVFDENQKEKANEIIQAFEEDSKDEIGLESIKRALSSKMFPGTSVLHTRLRYVYLIMDIYYKGCLESVDNIKQFTELELKQRKKLKQIDNTGGIIGGDSGEKELAQPAFSIYYNLLKTWEFIDDVKRKDLDRNDFDEDVIEIIENKNFTDNHFNLSSKEKDTIIKKIPDSILKSIFECKLQSPDIFEKKRFIDIDPNSFCLSEDEIKLFKNAQNFSVLMWGVMIYYNYFLNETEELKSEFEEWEAKVKIIIKSWKPEDTLNEVVSDLNYSRYNKDRHFINEWYEYVKSNINNLSLEHPKQMNKKELREWLYEREEFLKQKKSRLYQKNEGQTFNSYYGLSPISFRWGNVIRFKKDFDYVAN